MIPQKKFYTFKINVIIIIIKNITENETTEKQKEEEIYFLIVFSQNIISKTVNFKMALDNSNDIPIIGLFKN